MVFLLGPGDCCEEDCVNCNANGTPSQMQVVIPSDWTTNGCTQVQCDVSVGTFVLDYTADNTKIHAGCGVVCAWGFAFGPRDTCEWELLSACTRDIASGKELYVNLQGLQSGLPFVLEWAVNLPITDDTIDCTFGGNPLAVPFIGQSAFAPCQWGGASVTVTSL